MRGLEDTRLSAYAVIADGRTVDLPGPHTGQDGPLGLRLQGGRVFLEGLDEAGHLLRVQNLDPARVELFVHVLKPGEGNAQDV